MRVISLSLLLAALMALLAGCAASTALSSGYNTALDAVDLQTMTDRMARSIAAESRVQDAVVADGKLIVVVQPVENRLTGEVLPGGQAELFTVRVRTLLSKHAPDSFTWVMNRDSFHRLREKERDLDLGPVPDRLQPQYALTARFTSLTDESSARRTAAYLCVYQLTSIRTGAVIWTDKYEVKKTALKDRLLD
jgi:PBP1b-binding outer membrane lipoprotein LpoB